MMVVPVSVQSASAPVNRKVHMCVCVSVNMSIHMTIRMSTYRPEQLIERLTVGKCYCFRVRFIYVFGAGGWSAPSNMVLIPDIDMLQLTNVEALDAKTVGHQQSVNAVSALSLTTAAPAMPLTAAPSAHVDPAGSSTVPDLSTPPSFLHSVPHSVPHSVSADLPAMAGRLSATSRHAAASALWRVPSAAHRALMAMAMPSRSGQPSVAVLAKTKQLLSEPSCCTRFKILKVCNVHMPARPSIDPCVRSSVCPPACPSVCLSIRPSVCPVVPPSVCPHTFQFVLLSTFLSARPPTHPCPSVRPSVHPSIHPSVRPSVRLCAIGPCTHVSVCP